MSVATLGAVAGFIVLLLYAKEARAYLDPSSGSILIQIILGGIAGFFVLLKIYWRRIRRFLGRSKIEEPAEVQEQNTSND